MIEVAFVIFAISHAIVIAFFEKQRKQIAALQHIIRTAKAAGTDREPQLRISSKTSQK